MLPSVSVRNVILAAFIAGLSASPAFAQSSMLDQFDPFSVQGNGFHLYSVGASASWFSSSYGIAFRSAQDQSNHPLLLAGNLSFGYDYKGDKKHLSIIYAPTYTRGYFLNDYKLFDQYLALSMGTKIGQRWNLDLTAASMLSDYNMLLFAPPRLGVPDPNASTPAGPTPATPNPTPLPGTSPDVAYLFGNREWSNNADVSLAYEYSPRSTITALADAMRTQYVGGDHTNGVPTYVVPRITTINGDLEWTWSVTPLTQISSDGGAVRLMSVNEDLYSVHQREWVRHNLTPVWAVQGMLGVGTVIPDGGKLVKTGDRTSPEWGGGATYTGIEHTIEALFTRTVSDAYGLGSAATESGDVTWTWKRPGRTYYLLGVLGASRFVSTVHGTAFSYTGRMGITKTLNSHMTMSVAYSYAHFPIALIAGDRTGLTRNGLILEINFSPAPRI